MVANGPAPPHHPPAPLSLLLPTTVQYCGRVGRITATTITITHYHYHYDYSGSSSQQFYSGRVTQQSRVVCVFLEKYTVVLLLFKI